LTGEQRHIFRIAAAFSGEIRSPVCPIRGLRRNFLGEIMEAVTHSLAGSRKAGWMETEALGMQA